MADRLSELGYHAEPLNQENVSLLGPLMSASFGRDVPPGYFEWKFFASPHGNVVGTLIRHSVSGDPASYYGLIPTAYRFDGEVRTVYHATDGMTHPDHRRKQLYVEACRTTYARLPADFVGIGFSSHDLVKPYLMLGWQHPFEIPFYFRPRILSRLSRLRRTGIIAPAPLTSQSFPAIRASRANSPTTLELTDAFLTWRFANPSKSYRIIAEGASFAIYVIINRLLCLIDLHAETPDQRKRLRRSLDEIVLTEKLKGMLTFSQRGAPFESVLKASGFFRNDTGRGPAANRIPFVTWSKDAAMHLPSAWAMTPLDYDAY